VNYEPGLDGLRGAAVAAVVLFHAGYAWAVGGFLGVSTFFTLSGFLITSLLLRERESTGRIDLLAFWGRRARRLLPAAVVTLLGVAILARWLASPEQLAGLRGDVVSAALYGSNWRFIVDGHSYADLFAAPSPVLHFWSLSIEEQLYVLFPLLVVAVGVVRARLAVALGGLVVLSVALAVVLHEPGGSTTAAYYGTFVRGGELFVGALLAVLVTPARRIRAASVTKTVGVVGVLALGALVWAWSTVRVDDDVLYRGGFVVHAAVSAIVILAATQPGPVRTLLSVPPLRALGRISYGVYLYHWPVFVWWDAPLAARLALTLALAIASYQLIEQPIRERRVRLPVAAVPAAMAVVAAAVVVATVGAPAPQPYALTSAAAPPAGDLDGLPRVAVFGDSTALRTGFGLRGWGWRNLRVDVRDGGADPGCPLARAGIVDFVTERRQPKEECDDWPARWEAIARDEQLDAAIVQIGPWDVTDRQLDGRWTHIGEPAYDALLEREMQLAVDVLSAAGARVIWLTSPRIEFGRGQPTADRDHPISDPERMDRLNELIAEVDAERDEMVVLDLAGHLRELGDELDPDLRPDGVHFSEEAAAELVEWLGPAVLDLVPRR
jgi:peptidoglycan/LPS O-acetylase OafA/YrhL